jgi:diadenosine tetraphosphate (Ap4A) HIT family hydrolase
MKILSRQEYYEERKKSTSPECVLCHQKQLVLGETKYWRWIAARAPYWKYHTMIVPKRHFVELYEINDEEWNELKKLMNLLEIC